MAWANDNATLFYVTKDKMDRPHKARCSSRPHDIFLHAQCLQRYCAWSCILKRVISIVRDAKTVACAAGIPQWAAPCVTAKAQLTRYHDTRKLQ